MPKIYYSNSPSVKPIVFRDKEYLSSERLRGKMFYAEQVLDGGYTLARYFRLSNDLAQKNGTPNPGTQGYVIDSMAHHHFIAGLITLVMLGLTGLAWLYYKSQEELKAKIIKEKEEKYGSHAQIISTLNPKLVVSDQKEENKFETDVQVTQCDANLEVEKEVKGLQENLRTALNGPRRDQFAQFKNATIDRDEEKGIFLEFKPLFNIKNMVMTTWNMLFLTAFKYWLGWIIMGTLLGTLGVGLAGCSAMISFGVPFAFGLVYAGTKAKHWYDHQKEDSPLTLQELMAADQLMAYCNEPNDTVQQTNTPHTLFSVLRTAAACVIGAASGFIAAQYILWYLSDFVISYFIPEILGYQLLIDTFSILAFVAAAVLGGIAALGKHKEIANTPQIAPQERKPLEDEYAKLKLEIKECRKMLNSQQSYIDWLARIVGETLEGPYYKFWDYFMSGAYIARIFTLLCTSPFIPSFFHMVTAVAVLSNMATVLLIIGAGVTWAVFRTCIRIVEEKAKEKEALKENCELARIELQILQGLVEENSLQMKIKLSDENEKIECSPSLKQQQDLGSPKKLELVSTRKAKEFSLTFPLLQQTIFSRSVHTADESMPRASQRRLSSNGTTLT